MADCALPCSSFAAAESLWPAPRAARQKKSRRRGAEYPLAFAISALAHVVIVLLCLRSLEEGKAEILLGSGAVGKSFAVSLVSLGSSSPGAGGLPAAAPRQSIETAQARPVTQRGAQPSIEGPRASLAARPAAAPAIAGRAEADGKGFGGESSVAGGSGAPGSAGGGGGAYSSVYVEGMSAPSYPLSSRRRGEEGRVVYEVLVSEDGRVKDYKLLRSSSHAALDRAALTALQRAVFRPAVRSGQPIEARKKIAFRFRLDR